jgi:threonine dehydrogenase-like Zn-dependent dehydrogenase
METLRAKGEVTHMRAVRFNGRTPSLEAATPVPALKPGEALIRVTRAAVASPDLAVLDGRIRFTGTLGHEFVGVVERVNPARPEHAKWDGKRVVGSINVVCGKCELCRGGISSHCQTRAVIGLHGRDGCFAERLVMPVVNLCEVPRSVHDDAAVFGNAIGAVIHAAQIIRIEGKPFVTVLGDGPVGLLAAQVMTRLNASVRLLGKHPQKFGLCEKWGIKHRHVEEVGRRQDQDVIIDCTGSPEGLDLAMRLVRPRGKIVIKTAPGPVPVGALAPAPAPIDLSPAVCNELEVLGAGCGSLADAMNALAHQEVEVLSMITRRFKLADAAAALKAAAEPGAIKVLIDVA